MFKFVIAKDEDTAANMQKLGFKLVRSSDDQFLFVNDAARLKRLYAAYDDKVNIVFTNILCF